ncbi:MAG: FHA domain-containing protein [Myxococcales bacterium]|nr:FHA domain-containing protein [Myxococcales bacterium]
MLDRFKGLFGGTPAPSRAGARHLSRVAGEEGRQAWKERKGGRAEKWTSKRKPGPRPPAADDEPVEETCKTCGEPLLVEWGGVCPNCKPKIASPKTLFAARSDLFGATAVSLGWLVVLRSPDAPQQGTLLELEQAQNILTRAGAPALPGARLYAFNDEYMSVGNATIRRPFGGDRDAAFTLEDRRTPGPSANGTWHNARRLGPSEVVMLGDGDIVRVGTTEFLFKSLWLPPGSAS